MDKGSYRGRHVDLTDYAASVFNPYLFAGSRRCGLGCGASALALFTGIAPEVIARENGRAHYPDRFMIRFLRARGFAVLHLTLCNLSATPGIVGREHVLLLSQLFRQNEATWGVVFGNAYYHNFETYGLDTLSFLNKPVLSAYLVLHPKWRLKRTPKKFFATKAKITKKAVPFSVLGFGDKQLPP